MAREVSGALRVSGIVIACAFIALLVLFVAGLVGTGPAAPSASKADQAVSRHLTKQGLKTKDIWCAAGFASQGEIPQGRCDITLAPPLSATEFAEVLPVLATLPDAGITITERGVVSTPVSATRIFVDPAPSDCADPGGCADSVWAEVQGIDLTGPFAAPFADVLRSTTPQSVSMSSDAEAGRVEIELRTSVADVSQLNENVDALFAANEGFVAAGATDLEQELSVCVTDEGDGGECRSSVLLSAYQPYTDADRALVHTAIAHIGSDDVVGVIIRNNKKRAALDVAFRVAPGTACWTVPDDVVAKLPAESSARAFIPDESTDVPACAP